jgi:hypothetical protein
MRFLIWKASAKTAWVSVLVLLACLGPACAEEVLEIRYSDVPHLKYDNQILRMALEATASTRGPFRLVPVPKEIPNSRLIPGMISGRAELDVALWAASREMERSLEPIRIPIDKGTLGWRVFIIRKADEAKFGAIQSAEELKKLTAGQGDWPDVEIYEHNGYPVQIVREFESLFPMLDSGRFDYLPLGINECHFILEMQKADFPNLAVEKRLAIHYPHTRYFYPINNETGSRIRVRLTEGLERIIADGSFDRAFREFYGAALAQVNMKDRRVFELQNPKLPDTLPLDRKELWYSPGGSD